jgi:hypothetical protein
VPCAPVNVSSSGDNQIIAGVAGKTIRVLSYTLTINGAVNVYWKSGTSGTGTNTTLTGPLYGASAGGGEVATGPPGVEPLFWCVVGDGLYLNLSGAVAVGGHVTYAISG